LVVDEKIPENVAEVLEAVWTLQEKGVALLGDLAGEAATDVTDDLLAFLLKDELLAIDDGDCSVRLTAKGRGLAEKIIRRHRLAERLICEVLGVRVEESEEAACEFEHLLAENLANSICTLLGHPRFCPHLRAIPEGECCRQAREQLSPIVVPLDRLQLGEAGRIAYLSTRDHGVLQRLSVLGLSPGVEVRLLQRWPSYVVECEESEIAMEQELARNLYVWRDARA
jgi:DtxR family Mn-dependent transcriptional regulator